PRDRGDLRRRHADPSQVPPRPRRPRARGRSRRQPDRRPRARRVGLVARRVRVRHPECRRMSVPIASTRRDSRVTASRGLLGMSLGLAVAAAALALAPAPAHADPVRDAQYWLDEYGIRAAWQRTLGEGVTIAVIDTGVDATVRELGGAVLP